MRRFNDEIASQYPDWFVNQPKSAPAPVVKSVKRSTPGYVLPMLLTLVMMAIYAGILNYKNLQHHKELEDNIALIESDVVKNREAIMLLAILHNENFAVVRNATGVRNLIFINNDWTINSVPQHIKLSEAEIKKIRNKYLRKPVKPKAIDPVDLKADTLPQS